MARCYAPPPPGWSAACSGTPPTVLFLFAALSFASRAGTLGFYNVLFAVTCGHINSMSTGAASTPSIGRFTCRAFTRTGPCVRHLSPTISALLTLVLLLPTTRLTLLLFISSFALPHPCGLPGTGTCALVPARRLHIPFVLSFWVLLRDVSRAATISCPLGAVSHLYHGLWHGVSCCRHSHRAKKSFRFRGGVNLGGFGLL